MQLVTNCNGNADVGGTYTFSNTVPMNPGQYYYIVIDGQFGDVCEFSIDVTEGSTEAIPVTDEPSIVGPEEVCTGGSFTFESPSVPNASIYLWTVNGDVIGEDQISELSWDEPGVYTLCVEVANPCHPEGPQTCTVVTVNELATLHQQETICDEEIYNFEGQNLTESGTYETIIYTDEGCIQPIVLNLTVIPDVITDLEEEICEGDLYYLGNDPLYESGFYTSVFASYTGCDSIVNVLLTVNPVGETFLDEIICQYDEIEVGGESYFETDFYVIYLTTSTGCDSIIYLNLFVDVPSETYLEETICLGEIIEINDEYFYDTGYYSTTIIKESGCDSTIYLDLQVIELETFLEETICLGQTYSIGSTEYATTGSYAEFVPSSVGCDSIVNLELTVLEAPVEYLEATICEGENFLFGNSEYSATGTYEESFPWGNNCDSLAILTLNVIDIPQTALDITICDGESYFVGSSMYSTSGIFQDVFISSAGCDSLVNLNLTVTPLDEVFLTESICEGENVMVGTSIYSSTGSYQDVLSGSDGCDSLVHLDLMVLQVLETNINANICDGQSYDLGNSSFTTTGNYQEMFISATGCDSIVYLDLLVTSILETNIDITICEGQSYEVGTSSYSTDGTYMEALISDLGCDSVVTLNLSVVETFITNLNESICEGEMFEVGSSSYSLSGDYQDLLISSIGCDSIINLNLTVNSIKETQLNETLCEGETISVGNSVYSSSGNYQEVLTDVHGCDSIVNLALIVHPIPVTDLNIAICEGETYGVGSSQYSASGSYQDILVAYTSCDSIVNLILTVNPVPVTNLNPSICEGESYEFGNSSISVTGLYQEVLTSVNGCDSIVNLDLNVIPIPVTTLVESICNGSSYTVGSSVYSSTGSYQDVLVASSGCDSIVNLELTAVDAFETFLDESICEGGSYSVGSSTYSTPGTYEDFFISNSGCDSIVYLNLTILGVIEAFIYRDICEGSITQVGNSIYNESGSYQDVLTGSNGCDSIVFLELSVLPVLEVTIEETICDDESYTVGNSTYTEEGVYQDVLVSSNGCDSIVNLALSLRPCSMDVLASAQDVACNGASDGSISLSVISGIAPYSFEWTETISGNFGTGTMPNEGTPTVIDGLSAGTYSITVYDNSDIIQTATGTVNEPSQITSDFLLSDFGNYNLSCFGAEDGFIQVFPEGGTPPYSYLWNTGSDKLEIEDIPAGAYEVTVTDGNGCEENFQTSVMAPAPLEVLPEIVSPLCFGEEDGVISVNSTNGGTSPYLYALNNDLYNSSNNFFNLPDGNYILAIQDANGCQWDSTLYLIPPVEFIVDLGDNIIISLGDSIQLDAKVNDAIASVSWEAGSELSCADCLTPTVKPQSATIYSVTVTNENGCIATDKIQVAVKIERDVFIPTAFSPDGDGFNDEFQIFGGPEVVKVKSFMIFNRWGETVHQYHNFTPGDIAHVWNGKHRDKTVNSGVFIYFAQIEFLDGKTILYKGSVTVTN
ncbi:MAG: hypothetical protein GY751_11525 [Bacteroidetes bacterium]|nr:hypothetical protein [Bacteroidota bacterium]